MSLSTSTPTPPSLSLDASVRSTSSTTYATSAWSYLGRLSRVKKFQICLWVVALLVSISMQENIFLLSREAPPEDTNVKLKNQTFVAGHPTTRNSKPTIPATPAPTLRPTTSPPTRLPTRVPTTPPPTWLAASKPTTTLTNTNLRPTLQSQQQSQMPPSAFTIQTPPTQYLGKALEELPLKAQSFVAQNCDLQNVKEWYPSREDNSWNVKAPYVILGGVWNAGVTSLSQALQLHPQIRKRVGLPDFFLPRQFYKYQTTTKDNSRISKVFAARQRMYAQVYSKIAPKSLGSIAMDVSPGYLFYASQTSKSIQCVSPWAKMVILLRDPVERVYQQWIYGREKLGLRLSLEEWMAQELKAMQSAGLISAAAGTDTNRQLVVNDAAKEQERQAWKNYQSIRNLAGAIGRSMYVLQLEEWFETLEQVGKIPRQEVFLMRSEVWQSQPQEEYQQLISFLGLAAYQPAAFPATPQTNDNPPIKPETKQLLQDFFAPYNKRLADLLNRYGFNEDGDWNEPLWEG